LLGRGLKVSTVKLRLNCLTGLFTIVVEEEWFTANPFSGVGKRLKVVTVNHSQKLDVNSLLVHKLTPLQQDLFQLLRYIGCRLAECAGLELSEMNLDSGTIRIVPKPDRPLKTRESSREVPIHTRLRPTIEKLTVAGDQRPWRTLYNPRTSRWGEGIVWGPLIGCNPHRLRHHAVLCMR
jgi:site-specific recombinase XerC